MSIEKSNRPPVVFVSYSHDDEEHMQWVCSLAEQLRANGIDAILDQWELSLGRDTAKFMESIAEADRVLLICTENYVAKANGRTGGVGYESTILTSELIRDLNTEKFIPVIRQPNGGNQVPHWANTRFRVDMSNQQLWSRNFEVLIRGLLKAPKFTKPPLGKNPYAEEITITGQQNPASIATPNWKTADETYQEALQFIQSADKVGWRRLALNARARSAEALSEWKIQSQKTDLANLGKEDWLRHTLTGFQTYSEIIAVLLATAEASGENFTDQIPLLDCVIAPPNYDKTSHVYTYYHYFPELLFFATQALVGGMLFTTNGGKAAITLANTKFFNPASDEPPVQLFRSKPLTGWPQIIDKCIYSWEFLQFAIRSCAWIKTAFGDERECQIGISAYYQLLSFLNFVALTMSGGVRDGRFRHAQVTVPLCFCTWPEDVAEKGYQLFLRQWPQVETVLRAKRLDQNAILTAWPIWIQEVNGWLADVYTPRGHSIYVPQVHLTEFLKQNNSMLP